MVCSGNSASHCCWFNGVECIYLEMDTMPRRRWVCGLMRELGDWDKVIESPEYRENIAPLYERFVWPLHSIKYDCKTWPSEGCDCDN